MTALLTDTPRPGDVDPCPPAPWCDEMAVIDDRWMECDRPEGHDDDHYDYARETSWRIEEQPHA